MVSIKEDLNVTRPFSVYIGPVSRGAAHESEPAWVTRGGGLGLLKSKPEYRRVLAGIAQICYFHFPDIFLRRRVECVESGSALQALRAQPRWIFLLLITINCSKELCYSSGLGENKIGIFLEQRHAIIVVLNIRICN